MKWIKIVTDIFDDEKVLLIESMPEADALIVIWFKLLCHAGKTNNQGVFQLNSVPYTEEMFATIFRRPLNTVRLAISTFKRFGMIEIIDETITISNWSKYQSLDSFEKAREYHRKFMAEKRKQQRELAQNKTFLNVNSPRDVNSDVNHDVNVQYPRIEQERELERDKEQEVNTPLTPQSPTGVGVVNNLKKEDRVIAEYAENFGELEETTEKVLRRWVYKYSAEWLYQAIYEAITNNAEQPLSYIRKVLQNWWELGEMSPSGKTIIDRLERILK
jgi:predicted phage replisome organizer